jgi:hypothetical protein
MTEPSGLGLKLVPKSQQAPNLREMGLAADRGMNRIYLKLKSQNIGEFNLLPNLMTWTNSLLILHFHQAGAQGAGRREKRRIPCHSNFRFSLALW